MEQTPRAFFQMTFEPVGSVCAARHARGGLRLQEKWRTRACVPHTPYMRATACLFIFQPTSGNFMLIESAFSVLPEVILGSGFIKITKEMNAVSLFSFALLNAFHSKNILDPLKFIQVEYSYETQKAPFNCQNKRTCDLYISYSGSKIGSKRLEKYGWRYNNYIEAKFFKSYNGTINQYGQDSNSSRYTAELVADLIRLIILVPEPHLITNPNNNANLKTASARYFLFLSNTKPGAYLNKFLGNDFINIFSKPQNFNDIDKPITIDLSKDKCAGLAKRIGTDFNKIKIELNQLTCFSHFPIIQTNHNNFDEIYMILIRIDSAIITKKQDDGDEISFSIDSNRNITESRAGAYREIRNFVARNIK